MQRAGHPHCTRRKRMLPFQRFLNMRPPSMIILKAGHRHLKPLGHLVLLWRIRIIQTEIADSLCMTGTFPGAIGVR